MCALEKKCAVTRSRKCFLCTPLRRVQSVASDWTRRRNKKTNSGWQPEVADRIVNAFLKYPTQVSTSRTASSITSGLTTYHPASCVVAILSKSKTTRVSSTRMWKTTEKRMMTLGVHVLFVKYCSKFSLRHSRHSRILGSSLTFNRFLPFVGICAIFISRRDCRWTSVITHLASWYPGLFINDMPCRLSSFPRRYTRLLYLPRCSAGAS